MSGRVFLGRTSSKQKTQGHNTVSPMRLKPATPRPPVKHSTTEPLCSSSSNFKISLTLVLSLNLLPQLLSEVSDWPPVFSAGHFYIPSPGEKKHKNISILHLSCRMSDLQFHSSCKHMLLSFKSVCNKEHKGVICNMTSSSNSSQSTRPVGRVLWEELLVHSRF